MSNLLTRVESLEAWAETQERRARRNLLWSCVGYAVLVIFVTAYTLIILPILKELTTPKVLGEQAHAWLQTELPAQRGALISYCMENSPVWAQSGVELVKSAVPALEEHAKTRLDTYSTEFADGIKVDFSPALTKAIAERGPELKAKYEEFKNSNKEQGVPEALAAMLGKEMDRYLTDEFVVATERLQAQLLDLATRPEDQLSRREEAQRRALSAWTVLSEEGKLSDGVLDDLMGKGNQLFIKYFSKETQTGSQTTEPAAETGEKKPDAGQ